jgi:hypothetical protein
MFNEPITTLEQAKTLYVAMGCSGFHMMREYPERHKEYLQLNIPKEKEAEWQKEEFEKFAQRLLENTTPEEFYPSHSRLTSLTIELQTEYSLMKLLDLTQQIKEKVPVLDRVVIAETINGRAARKARSGLIYYAFDRMKNISAARAFAEMALDYAKYDDDYVEDEFHTTKRCQQATDLCLSIQKELGL